MFNNDVGLIGDNIKHNNIKIDNNIDCDPPCNKDGGLVNDNNADNIGPLTSYRGVFTSTFLTIFLHLTDNVSYTKVGACDGKNQTNGNHSYLLHKKGNVSDDKNQNYNEDMQYNLLRDNTIPCDGNGHSRNKQI